MSYHALSASEFWEAEIPSDKRLGHMEATQGSNGARRIRLTAHPCLISRWSLQVVLRPQQAASQMTPQNPRATTFFSLLQAWEVCPASLKSAQCRGMCGFSGASDNRGVDKTLLGSCIRRLSLHYKSCWEKERKSSYPDQCFLTGSDRGLQDLLCGP